MTITIQIGNSDNKLLQREWHEYVKMVDAIIEYLVEDREVEVHFFAASAGDAPWQNAAWVLQVSDEIEPTLRARVTAARKNFQQESVAWTAGKTEFV